MTGISKRIAAALRSHPRGDAHVDECQDHAMKNCESAKTYARFTSPGTFFFISSETNPPAPAARDSRERKIS